MAVDQKGPARGVSAKGRSGPAAQAPRDDPTDGALHGMARVLHDVLERVHQTTGADIIALYPVAGETGSFSAPAGLGLQADDLYHALDDMAESLTRYRADSAQGRVPADLRPTHYGLATWLMVTHRTFVAADAPREVGSTFVQRYHIQATVALPLLTGGQTSALLMVNWSQDAARTSKDGPATGPAVEAIEAIAREAAPSITQARAAEEVATFRTLAELVETLSALEVTDTPRLNGRGSLPDAARGGLAALGATFSDHVEAALGRILETTDLDAAAVFVRQARVGGGALSLLAQRGLPNALGALDALKAAGGDLAADPQTRQLLAQAGYNAVAAFPLRARDGAHGALLVASRDRLAFLYTPEATHLLLQTAADRIGATLASKALVDTLEETNRTLIALGRFGQALVQPGASLHQVLQAVAAKLTDPTLPEFHFDVAVSYLLARSPLHGAWIRLAAGSTSSADPRPLGAELAGANIEPRWVSIPERPLDPLDVLSYVSAQRHIVVIGAHDDEGPDDLVSGYGAGEVERWRVPIVRSDNSSLGNVRAVVVMANPDIAPVKVLAQPAPGDFSAPDYLENHTFRLQGDLFEEHGHGRLVRVFVPFGEAPGAVGTAGVLEAGYLVDRRRGLDRTQIEALRNCATQVAAAVETARLYEETRRHAQHMEIVTEVGRAIASSIDLDQTLRLIARNMARTVDASTCQIALLEDDGSAWFGAAALDQEDQWRRERMERPQPSLVFEVVDRGKPMVVEDAARHDLIRPSYAATFGVRSLLILPLLTESAHPLGAVVLGQRDRPRLFTPEEVERALGLAQQAAVAIENAQVHAREEDDHHIQKDFVLIGFGVWGQKAYHHLLTLKQFFNFKTYVVEHDSPSRRAALAQLEAQVVANGDAIYWDSTEAPALVALSRDLEASCYVITYVATPAETHLPLVKKYYGLSDVILIEKPLGAPLDQYRAFLDNVDGHVQLVAADHYYFKLEVMLLQLLLSEERNLSSFLDGVEEIEIELLEEQPLAGTAAEIGIIADMMPHAFAILSLFTPLDRLRLVDDNPLRIGCYQPAAADKETYTRLVATYPHNGRDVRVIIDTGKGIANSKWIRLVGQRSQTGRRAFYRFDFGRGEAIDGTQSNLRAATRPIRQPGVPENAHLTMLRHVIEKKHPAVGILAIREAMRSNQRIQELEELAAKLRAANECVPYQQGQRPVFPDDTSRLH